jgi:phosphatidylinositol alpha-1,6-mannosyltransferase
VARFTLHSFVFFTPGLGGFGTGGIQQSARIAWQGLVRHARKNERTGALFSYGPVADLDGSEAGYPIVVARSRPALLLQSVVRCWSTHALLVWHLGLLKALPFLRGHREEIVLFLHGIEAWRPMGARQRRLFGRVTRFLSNSTCTWQRFLDFNPEFAGRPHQVVPLGSGEPAGADVPPDSPPAVLMVGRLCRSEDYKGHRELIAAWPRVLARVPEARLWIAGDGDLRPDLEVAAAATGVADRVRFWGRVSDEVKQDLLHGCRCLALPSRGEGFGLVYLEAMRVGRPCLVSTCDAGREVVNPPEAGLAADPKDADQLAGAIVRLLSPGAEWDRWSRAARRRYEARFTGADYQRRLVEAVFPEPVTGRRWRPLA